jgi:hypothetical protein
MKRRLAQNYANLFSYPCYHLVHDGFSVAKICAE